MNYTARRIPTHRGPAAWAEILGSGAQYPALKGAQTADVAIIGAGFAGLSAAWRLVQRDPQLKIALLEAGRIAQGASGRNSGFMIDLPHDLASDDYASTGDDAGQIRRNRMAIAFAADLAKQLGIPRAYFDPAGKINGACSDAALVQIRSYASHLENLGETYQMLGADEMGEITGSALYRGGLYTPGTVLLQPAGYVRALAAGFARRGALFENSPVLSVKKEKSNWRLGTANGQISAGKVIMAVNGHLESFGVVRGQLIQLFLYASMSEPLEQTRGAARWGVTPADPMGTTMRRIDQSQGGSRIITRNYATVRPGMHPSKHDLRRAARRHHAKFAEHFPHLNGVRQEYVWSGHLCLSRNGVAVCRPLDEGLFSACVQNGLGTARGTLTGIAAADMVLGHTSDLSAYFAAEHSPTPLPPQPFAAFGANAYIAFKEWRARTE